MRKVYYLDISNVNLSDINVKIISERKLNKTKLVLNEKKKIQTLCAYLLLRYAFKEFNFELNDYNISYQNNKPVIEGINYSFHNQFQPHCH